MYSDCKGRALASYRSTGAVKKTNMQALFSSCIELLWFWIFFHEKVICCTPNEDVDLQNLDNTNQFSCKIVKIKSCEICHIIFKINEINFTKFIEKQN